MIDKVTKSETSKDSSKSQNAKNALPFDFRMPNRISNTQLNILRSIHDSFADPFSSFLVTKLQTMVNVKVKTVEQIYYSEYVTTVPDPSCLFIFELKGTDIKGLVELNLNLASIIVEILLGGPGNGNKKSNIITQIEQKVLMVIIDHMMLDLQKAWMAINKYDFIVDRFEPNIDFAGITSQNESILQVGFEINIIEKTFPMNICFATYAFDTISAGMSKHRLASVRPVNHNGITSFEILSNHLQDTLVPISVILGKSTITFKELMELNVGDVIKLFTKISDEQLVKVVDEDFFLGRIGVTNNHKSIKITKKIKSNINNI